MATKKATQTYQGRALHEHMKDPAFQKRHRDNHIAASKKFTERFHSDPEFRERHRKAALDGLERAVARHRAAEAAE
jgi:hypothetical protein